MKYKVEQNMREVKQRNAELKQMQQLPDQTKMDQEHIDICSLMQRDRARAFS